MKSRDPRKIAAGAVILFLVLMLLQLSCPSRQPETQAEVKHPRPAAASPAAPRPAAKRAARESEDIVASSEADAAWSGATAVDSTSWDSGGGGEPAEEAPRPKRKRPFLRLRKGKKSAVASKMTTAELEATLQDPEDQEDDGKDHPEDETPEDAEAAKAASSVDTFHAAMAQEDKGQPAEEAEDALLGGGHR